MRKKGARKKEVRNKAIRAEEGEGGDEAKKAFTGFLSFQLRKLFWRISTVSNQPFLS